MKKLWETYDERIVIRLLFTPHENTLLTLDFQSYVKVWDFPQRHVKQEINSETQRLCPLEMSDDGRYLVVVALNGSRLYERQNGEFRDFKAQFRPRSIATKFLPHSHKMLCSSASAPSIGIYNFDTKKTIGYAEDTGDRCMGITFHPDNDLFALSSCWSASSCLMLMRLSDREYRYENIILEYDVLTSPTFSGDGRWLSVAHWIPVVYGMEDLKNVGPKEAATPRYQFGNQGELLPEFSASSTVKWQAMWTRQIFEMKRNVVIAGSPEGKIFVWNLEDGSLRTEVQAHQGRVYDIALSLDGNSIISCGADNYLRVWEL